MQRLKIITLAVAALSIPLLAYGTTAKSSVQYVALGDSVAAGAGLTTSGNSNDAICDRSNEAYPHLVAQSLGTTAEHYACTAAKVDDGIYGSQTRENTELFPQLDRAFLNGTPDVLTMTIGANDARWTNFLQACYAWECGTRAETYAGKVLRVDLRAELYYALHKIEQRSGDNPPQVLLSGYYMPLSDDVSCVATERVTANEIAWLQSEFENLNDAIKDTTEYFDFATYVPVDFTGHELCSSDPWVQDLTDDVPFHPTAEGHQAIGRAFVDAL